MTQHFSLKEKFFLLFGIIALVISTFFLLSGDSQDNSASAAVQSLALIANQPGSVICASGTLSVVSQDPQTATMRVVCTGTSAPTPTASPISTPIPTPVVTPTPAPATPPVAGSCLTSMTREQVATHTNPDTDCWVVIYDKVYNVSKNNTVGVSKFDGGTHYGRVAVDGVCGFDLTDGTPVQSKGFVDYGKHFSNGEIKSRVIEIFDQLCVGTVSN